MKFSKKNLNYSVNPYSGLSRKSWEEAGKYILSGIFRNISSIEEPILFPRKEMEITYPHDKDNDLERMAERFEGLARSFFIAAPLIHYDPEMKIGNFNIREYYKYQVLRSCTKGDSLCVGHYDDLMEKIGEKDPFHTFQQTVESAALVICLWMCKSEIWDTYSPDEKDKIVDFIKGYAYGNTIPNNWQLFNMLDLAFLNMEGYPIEKEVMHHYAQSILNLYAGDGWYRDGHTFDYYSCWGFNLYAPIWNNWYGYENEPEIAARFEEYSNTFMQTFSNMFDKESFINMWGRSSIYRNAVTSAFFGNLLLKKSICNPGLARKISSGALRQFFDREDTFPSGLPNLGFYGQFSQLIQGYSCAESPLWIGKAFMCLYLPETHSFWQASEKNGIWDELEANQTKVTTLNGPALSFSNHGGNGETLLRSGKVLRNKDIYADMWNYSRLCFSTKYPWEATPNDSLEAQQYVLENLFDSHFERGNFIAWCGEKKKVLYRRMFFDYASPTEFTWLNKIDLADFPIPKGLIRVDKLHLLNRPIVIRLGAFGFPDNGTEITEMSEGTAKAVVLKGYDSIGRPRQLALTIYNGWEDICQFRSIGTNPESEHSILLYAKTKQEKYLKKSPFLISQVITKESHEMFDFDEIFSVKTIEYASDKQTTDIPEVAITMKDGSVKEIDYSLMEGNLDI